MHRQRCDARDPNLADVPKGAPAKGRCPNMAGGLGICSDIMRYNDGMDILYNQKYESTAINMFFCTSEMWSSPRLSFKFGK